MHIRHDTMTRRKALKAIALIGAGLVTSSAPGAGFPPQAVIDADPLRPRFHLMPRRGWMNDPCAPVYFRGRYHMFFQYNPGASVWGDMHWAHAVSPNMVQWTARPMALAPTAGGPDAFGVFTGSMVLDRDVPTILYTCVSPSTQAKATLWGSDPPKREQQCLATPAKAQAAGPDGALDRWEKFPQPVLPAPPPGMNITGFRDPVPWREADGSYYILVASGRKKIGGNVLLYKSADLRSWQFQHIFAEGKWTGEAKPDTVDTGEMWECPDFFPLGDKHVLIHSTGTSSGRKTLWQSGSLNKATMRWTPEQEGVLNHGPYYAPKTQTDADGNRILWGWIEETRPKEEFAKAGWAGCMSLPRTVTLNNGMLRFAPARQVEGLRGKPMRDPASRQCETVLKVRRRQVSSGTLLESAALRIESSGDSDNVTWNGVPLPETQLPDVFTIRCFIDHSVVEIFLSDRAALTCRVYQGSAAHLRLPAGFHAVEQQAYAVRSVT